MQKRKVGRMAEILDGLNWKQKLKVRYTNLKSKIESYLKKHDKQVTFLINYSFSGFWLGIFFYIFLSIWLDLSWLRFISTIIASIIGLIYSEHYFLVKDEEI